MHVQLPRLLESSAPVPDRVFGYVAASAASGISRFDAAKMLSKTVAHVAQYYARPETLAQARRSVESSGLTVVAASRLGLAAYGPRTAWEELTGGQVVTRERVMRVSRGRERYVTHLDIVGKDQPSPLGVGVPRSTTTGIERVVLNRPRFPHAITPSPIPPTVSQFHLRLPEDVALGLNAREAQQAGANGQGVIIAMVDTGQFNHPFFVANHYDVRNAQVVFPEARADKDPVGHGTGESANVFAIAPLTILQPYRCTDDHGGFQPETGFLLAKQDNPKIITNSWGGDGPYPPDPNADVADLPFVHEVQDAIQSGIVVVFSAGNGHFSVEPQIPGVLSAGGVFMDSGMALSASNYASGYDSPWFGGVRVPIVCGLVGLLPRAHLPHATRAAGLRA